VSELIEYTTATRMAAVYKQSVARVKSLIVELGDECDKLKKAFDCDSGYSFSVDVYFESHQHDANADTAMAVGGAMKRAAWRALIQKLGIRKVMSSKRQKELDEALSGQKRNRYGESEPELLPEIDEETIYDVLSGMIQSAEEFMAEAVREEYDFFKPSKNYAPYKRNSERNDILDKALLGIYNLGRRKGNQPCLQSINQPKVGIFIRRIAGRKARLPAPTQT